VAAVQYTFTHKQYEEYRKGNKHNNTHFKILGNIWRKILGKDFEEKFRRKKLEEKMEKKSRKNASSLHVCAFFCH
jgi:hypothetical protein